MKRPHQFDDDYYPFSIKQNMENFIEDIERYCDYLEEQHAELLQNYTDCVKHNNELIRINFVWGRDSRLLAALFDTKVEEWEGFESAYKQYLENEN